MVALSMQTLSIVWAGAFLGALAAGGAGAWLGFQIYGRLDERRFKQVPSAMLIASGLSLVI
jgi:putative Ca2+/H+ antiporter (TMEM165/GDT1 family)